MEERRKKDKREMTHPNPLTEESSLLHHDNSEHLERQHRHSSSRHKHLGEDVPLYSRRTYVTYMHAIVTNRLVPLLGSQSQPYSCHHTLQK